MFLGMRVADAGDLDDIVRIGLSQEEIAELTRLKSCSWLKSDNDWQGEMDRVVGNGFKIEVEAMCSRSVDFLAESYLPEKLAEGKWLRWNGTREAS